MSGAREAPKIMSNAKVEISEQEYKSLKEQSNMLGLIASYVEEFCHEEATTLMGVLTLLSKYHYCRYELAEHDLERSSKRNK